MEELDIIIPAYNAKNTLRRLGYSIATQKNINNFKVYIVNDCSDYDYHEIIEFFKNFFWIKELKLEKNMGPGYARQYGIDHSYGKYITFIDADDFLYSPNSLYNLCKPLKYNYDLIISNFIYEHSNQNIIMKNDCTWLHGKVFKREFLQKNSIRFNNTRSNEDNGFNHLVRFHYPKTLFLDKITYVYYANPESTTRKNNAIYEFYGLEYYAYNLQWAINSAIEKNINSYDIVKTSLRVLISMYFYYLDFYNKYDVSKICFWSKDLKKIFDKYYKKYISDSMIKKEIESKNNEYIEKNINIDFKISFYEFLNLVREA